jgi:hypothetical protein
MGRGIGARTGQEILAGSSGAVWIHSGRTLDRICSGDGSKDGTGESGGVFRCSVDTQRQNH